ncbi:SRPBCC family protein [Pseudactinotalea sp. Z1739]|uniref:SRPBCC family protein n=1 Tax=Pseudactinotalea sp. Z1739 TaxID=3413028 RepID=UPI003C7BE15F
MQRSYAESITVAASPESIYALVSDVTRTGEWSPICRRCEWEDPDNTGVGAQFTGFNETPQRSWQTRSTVVAAEPGRAFAWEVGDGYVRWGYALRPVDGGTEVTEHWEFLPAGLEMFARRYGAEAPSQIEERTRAAHQGIPRTLAAIKDIAEAERHTTDPPAAPR